MKRQQPHNLKDLLTGLHDIDVSLKQQQIPKNVILLMGQTKAGKTTLFYYLLGKKLIWEKNSLDVWQMRPQTVYFIAHIGEGYDSTTVYPNIPVDVFQNAAMVIDMPGFDDNRPHFRLLNVYIMLQMLKLIENVHICHVIPEECCQSDALISEFQKISSIFNKEILTKSKYLSFIITKVENSNIRESFLNQIDDILQSNFMSHLEDELKEFKQKNMYQFANEQPILAKGIQLKQEIQNQNTFYNINHEPRSILSETYYKEMIGKNNLQQFIDYLISIIKNMKEVTQVLISLYCDVVKIQFHQLISSALGLDETQFVSELVQSITSKNQIHCLIGLNNIKIQTKTSRQLHKQNIITLLKCFEKQQQIKDDDRKLVNLLFFFSSNTSLIRKSSSFIIQDYLLNLQNLLKQIGSLILTIQQVKFNQIQQVLKDVTNNKQLFNIVQSLNNFWEENYQAILNTEQFKVFANDQEVVCLLNKQNLLSDETIVRKTKKFQKVRNKKIVSQMSNKNSSQFHKISIDHIYVDLWTLFNAEQTDEVLKCLPISLQSFQYLKNQYDRLDFDKDKWLIRKVLRKISQIFYWFTYFQEAIMFKMAIPDENSIEQLFIQGMECEQISIQFIRSILIPYYSQINISLRMLQSCYNSITHLLEVPQECYEIEKERIDILKRASQNQNCYLLLDHYKQLELYYINPIMQRFEYYQKQIYKKEVLFNKSPIASLTGFINKTMKQ